MIIQKCVQNGYSMIVAVPAKLRRQLGWTKGDTVQVYVKNGVLCYQKVRITNVKYRKRDAERRDEGTAAARVKPSIRGRATE